MKKRVVVGLSGGVDSSVAAYLLLRQGYEVIALFMKNWHDDSVTISKECPWLEDSNDAMIVAQHLGIAYQVVDLSTAYKERIVNYMFSEYEKGRTPNPDVLCNREIKFDVFLEMALKLGADYVATGHYCRKKTIYKEQKPVHRLLSGKDIHKDQSYFLCQLSQRQLSKALFPIGHLTKSQVRAIAQKKGLVTAQKKDSQGLCFVGKVRLPAFLQQRLKPKKGRIVAIDKDSALYKKKKVSFKDKWQELRYKNTPIAYKVTDGKIVGVHQGAHYFTVGQRKGLAVGGTVEPLYVIATDVVENVVYVGEGKRHKGLYKKVLFVKCDEIHWVREDLQLEIGEKKDFSVKIRYRQDGQKATLYREKEGLYVCFENYQFAMAKGQFVAWYQAKELIGSGVIS